MRIIRKFFSLVRTLMKRVLSLDKTDSEAKLILAEHSSVSGRQGICILSAQGMFDILIAKGRNIYLRYTSLVHD